MTLSAELTKLANVAIYSHSIQCNIDMSISSTHMMMRVMFYTSELSDVE